MAMGLENINDFDPQLPDSLTDTAIKPVGDGKWPMVPCIFLDFDDDKDSWY